MREEADMARITRRTFLRTTGIAGSTLVLSGLPYTIGSHWARSRSSGAACIADWTVFPGGAGAAGRRLRHESLPRVTRKQGDDYGNCRECFRGDQDTSVAHRRCCRGRALLAGADPDWGADHH